MAHTGHTLNALEKFHMLQRNREPFNSPDALKEYVIKDIGDTNFQTKKFIAIAGNFNENMVVILEEELK